MLKAGIVAGFLTAIVHTLVQSVTVAPLIHEAETYERTGAAVHSHAAIDGASPILVDAHGADDATAWAPTDGAERLAFSFLSNLVIGIGFACVLVAAMALRGRPVDARSGVIWGLAGFAAFTVAPSLGLPPEVPGSVAAELLARQTWWAATAFATATGLGLLVFARHRALQALGIVALLVPHLIGAPRPVAGEHGSVPPELAAQFVVWTLATAALFWAVLGASCGELYRRFA